MTGNVSPIFSRVGDIQWAAALTAANTALDGTGATATVFTADAANGGRVEFIRAKPLGTNVATVASVFINNGADPSKLPRTIRSSTILRFRLSRSRTSTPTRA
jgi:hypothetical protein